MTVRFYVDDVDFFTALNLACRVSKTMWSPLDTHQLLIAKNTPENHKQFDRMSLATFAVPGGSTPQEATELVSSLRNICEFPEDKPRAKWSSRSARSPGDVESVHHSHATVER